MTRPYIVSERAHLMCPDMHFAVSARISRAYDAAAFDASLAALQAAHPFVRSVVAFEEGTGRAYYDVKETLPLRVEIKSDTARLFDDYAAMAASGWNAAEEGLLRVMLYPAQGDFLVVFIAHHLLCDGRGLMALTMEFAAHYVHGKTPAYVEECLPQSMADLPKDARLPFISRMVVNSANKNWASEGRRVSYPEYLAFERDYLQKHPKMYEARVTGKADLAALAAKCKQHGVTVNDYLIADLMREENVEKVVIAADIRDKLTCYREGAMGNYATALSVVCKGRADDVMRAATEARRAVGQKMSRNDKLMLVLACYYAMTPELLDAVAISTLGDFPSKAGRFVGEKMFGFAAQDGRSVTNLGRYESDAIAEAAFIPPASPANSVTWGALTMNGVMKVCVARAGKASGA